MNLRGKILAFDSLIQKTAALKKAGKRVVQSHGIFDLIHPGIITHLEAAKSMGDVLVVTVIRDRDVRRGPGRPIFEDRMRAETVAALQMVDYVSVVDDEAPFECVRRLKPAIFAKGQAYKERDRRIHQQLFEEEKEFVFGKSKLYETPGLSFSTTKILQGFFDIYSEDTRLFLEGFRKKCDFKTFVREINSLSGMRVLLVGEGIIDEYHYCETMNKSAKSPIVVNRYLSEEVFAGGAFAVANHLSGICSEVNLVTVLGSRDSRKDFILDNLRPNVKPRFFFREDSPTIVKKRYLNSYMNQKLFEVNYLNSEDIDQKLEDRVIAEIESLARECDLVLICDFGHGLLTKKVIRAAGGAAKRLAVNTQTNGANAGYNLITKYPKASFICLDEIEARLAVQDKSGPIEGVLARLIKHIKTEKIIITLGKKGSIGMDRKGAVNLTPIFSTKVVDTVGAGDAFFAFTAPCVARGMKLEFVSFVGNAVGALAVQIMGNKKPVEKSDLFSFVHTLLA